MFQIRDFNAQQVALFLPILAGGGAERSMVNLANLFAKRGLQVDLVVANVSHPEGVLRNQVSPQVRLVDLGVSGVLRALPGLVRYLRRERPFALLSTLNHANIIAVWAKLLARTQTRVVIRVAITVSKEAEDANRGIVKLMPVLARLFFSSADDLVAVSEGVARDLIETIRVSSHKIAVIYNPVHAAKVQELARQPISHPFFKQPEPVLLGIGRLTTQKDFPTLIRAFAVVCRQRLCRLIILGEGEERPALEALIRKFELTGQVALPGFVENPYPYMRRVAVMILSSRFEGFPNVLPEAMACGCPVVSTNCPSGPAEILTEARYGRLVPIGDVQALAQAILETLDHPPNPADLQERVQVFAPEVIMERYLAILRSDK